MRGTRWLLLVAMAIILAVVGLTYRIQTRALERQAPPKPQSLPAGLAGSAQDWQLTQSDREGRPVVHIRAQNFSQVQESNRIALENVELQLFHKEGEEYDLVKSARAEFRSTEGVLYSDGDVEITLGVPAQGAPKRQLVSIRSSGVSFEKQTGRASTDRAAAFVFENGTGKAVGVSYDPSSKELHMRSQVELNWRAPGAKAMKLEAGDLVYRESSSKIFLAPWARLTRENSVLEAGDTVVTLKDGAIERVEAKRAKGFDRYPNRQIDYSADQLLVTFTETGDVQKAIGDSNARLVSTAEGSQTTIRSDRVEMEFESSEEGSVLKTALATGHGVLESKPLPVTGRQMPETRILRSELIEMKMRSGGREIEMVETHAPGKLEFLPNRPEQRRRQMDGERFWISYGPRNQIQSFRSVQVSTRTEPAAQGAPKGQAASQTWSQNLSADFNPVTGQLTRIEQWGDFRYEEGTRKARAQRAVSLSDRNLITLENAVRLSDDSGSTAADLIRLDQESGEFSAEGHVSSSRLPDKKESSKGMLAGDEPIQAVAQRMNSADHNRVVHYDGNAVVWQGSDRVQADSIDIDRAEKRLTAEGKVITQLLDKPKDGNSKSAAGKEAGGFTIVRAAKLRYTDSDRLAYYTGGVVLTSPNTQVKASQLRAYLNDSNSGADSRLDHAYADGQVEIVQNAPDRKRIGTGDHAEYYVEDEKIILRGGNPKLVDTKRGETRGTELTYFINDDRLLVNGLLQQPAMSEIRRR